MARPRTGSNILAADAIPGGYGRRPNRLRADAQGDIEILDAFWNLPPTTDYPDVVPPILAYADLIATLDPRNIEVAKLIREKYIDDAFHQA